MDKNTKLSRVQQVKAEIIVHCLDYIDNNSEEDRKQAIQKLTDYAKFYRISVRKKVGRTNIRVNLRKFILNKQGYIETISPLYNGLMNGDR